MNPKNKFKKISSKFDHALKKIVIYSIMLH